MRILLDTNIIIAGLISPKGPSAALIRGWLEGRFELVTAREQLDELSRVLTYKHLARLIDPAQACDFVDNVGVLAVLAVGLPNVAVSPDPADNIILAIAVAGEAVALDQPVVAPHENHRLILLHEARAEHVALDIHVLGVLVGTLDRPLGETYEGIVENRYHVALAVVIGRC